MSSDASIVNFFYYSSPSASSSFPSSFECLSLRLQLRPSKPRPIAKFGFFFFSLFFSFFIYRSSRETFLNRLPSPCRKSGLITSRAARARRRKVIKRTRAKAVLVGLSQVQSRSRGTIEHSVKVAGPKNWFRVSGIKLTQCPPDRTPRLFVAVSFIGTKDESRPNLSFARKLKHNRLSRNDFTPNTFFLFSLNLIRDRREICVWTKGICYTMQIRFPTNITRFRKVVGTF